MSLAAPTASRFQAVIGVLTRLWFAGGLAGRIALVGALVSLLGALVWLLLRRALRGGGKNLLRWLTGVSFAALVLLGTWVSRLPEPRGSSFILWHQLVRVGAALSGTAFIVCFMVLAVPWLMDRFEGRGFVAFVADFC